MPGSRRLLPVLAAAGAALAMVAATPAAGAVAPAALASAARSADPPGIVVRDGMTQPVFSFEDAIERQPPSAPVI